MSAATRLIGPFGALLVGGLALGIAGCGNSSADLAAAPLPAAPATSTPTPSSGSTGGAGAMTVQQYIQAQTRWVACARQHGMDAPEPDKTGQVLVPVTAKTKSDPAAVQQVMAACAQYSVPVPPSVTKLRAEAETPPPAEKKEYAAYATCMQTHGASDFPNPQPNGEPGEGDWDQTAAGAQRALAACAPIVGGGAVTSPGVG